MLIVHEPPNKKEGIIKENDEEVCHVFSDEKQLQTCGCFNKGSSKLTVRFAKNVFV